MTSTDQTVMLPRHETAAVDETPQRDPWQVDRPTGSAPVGGLNSTEAALNRLAWLLAVVLMAAAALVRVGWSSLSANELTTWTLATTSWSELWRLRHELDAFEAPYYGLIRVWAGVFGASEFSLRFPSVLAMVGAAGATAALVARLVGPRAGVIAGLLFVAVPATSRYAHEAGPEALAVAFAVLATVALVRCFERPVFWRWATYSGAVVVLGLAHGAALLLLLGHAGAVLALRRRVLPAWLLAAVIGATPVVGLLFVGRPPWDLPPGQMPFGLPSVTTVAEALFGLAVLGGVVLGLATMAFSLKRPAGVFAPAAVLPLAGSYVAAEVTAISMSKLLIFTLPFWLCLVAMAVHRAPLVRGLTVVGLVALIGLPTQLDIRTDDGHGHATRQVAEVLNGRVVEGDAIIYGPTPRDGRIGRDLVARYVAPGTRPDDVLAENAPRTGGRLLAEECVNVDLCLADAPRVWLLRADVATDPLDGLPGAKDGALRVRYELTRTWTFRGISLSLFTLGTDPS